MKRNGIPEDGVDTDGINPRMNRCGVGQAVRGIAPVGKPVKQTVGIDGQGSLGDEIATGE